MDQRYVKLIIINSERIECLFGKRKVSLLFILYVNDDDYYDKSDR